MRYQYTDDEMATLNADQIVQQFRDWPELANAARLVIDGHTPADNYDASNIATATIMLNRLMEVVGS